MLWWWTCYEDHRGFSWWQEGEECCDQDSDATHCCLGHQQGFKRKSAVWAWWKSFSLENQSLPGDAGTFYLSMTHTQFYLYHFQCLNIVCVSSGCWAKGNCWSPAGCQGKGMGQTSYYRGLPDSDVLELRRASPLPESVREKLLWNLQMGEISLEGRRISNSSMIWIQSAAIWSSSVWLALNTCHQTQQAAKLMTASPLKFWSTQAAITLLYILAVSNIFIINM